MINEGGVQRERQPLAPKVAVGQVVPLFTLPDTTGHPVDVWSFKGRRNLVLFFFHGSNCAGCRDVLTAFASDYQSYKDLDAEVLAITRDPVAIARALAEGLRLPFPVLCDTNGEVTQRYLPFLPSIAQPLAGLIIADRYGAVYDESLAGSDAELPDQNEILQWLQFINIQCDECGVPEWPRH